MKCYEYKNCPHSECPAHDDIETPCWMRDDTLCHRLTCGMLQKHGVATDKSIRHLICEDCSYYIAYSGKK